MFGVVKLCYGWLRLVFAHDWFEFVCLFEPLSLSRVELNCVDLVDGVSYN